MNFARTQGELFATGSPWPRGLSYSQAFLSASEEIALIEWLRSLPLEQARYKAWDAKRRVMSFGGSYDFDRNVLRAAPPIPPFLTGVRARAAAWAGIAETALDHALVAEYRPGTQLGWHRDVPDFEAVIGISLHGTARMRLRPYPHVVGSRVRGTWLELAPRSIYSLTGDARWRWQHAISPTKALRYSLTFRTLRSRPG